MPFRIRPAMDVALDIARLTFLSLRSRSLVI
jgi:hypothetical protein